MTALQIIFLFVGAMTLASAVMVVSARRIMHAALWLVLTLAGVAIIFALLDAGFLCHCAGAGLHRRHCHPDHLCHHADPQGI